MVTRSRTPKAKSKPKKTVGKSLTTSITAFVKRYTVVKELRNGMIVRDRRTGKLIKVYGDKEGRTVIEPYIK